MPNRITEIEIKEKNELEPMLVQDIEQIEQGLKFIGRQMPTDSGPLDILAVDSDGALVIIELKSVIDEGQLIQGLRYYDWVATNAAWISHAYKDIGIDPKESCRLILIAPGFDETTKRVARYIDIELDLKKYICFQLQDGTKTLVFESVGISPHPEVPKVYTIPEKLREIQDEKVRQLCTDAIDAMQKKQIEIRPIHGEWISCWFQNKRFMYMACKKKFFIFEILQSDGDWTSRLRVSTKKEWDNIFENQILPTCERISDNGQETSNLAESDPAHMD
jgi:hypothetical protein